MDLPVNNVNLSLGAKALLWALGTLLVTGLAATAQPGDEQRPESPPRSDAGALYRVANPDLRTLDRLRSGYDLWGLRRGEQPYALIWAEPEAAARLAAEGLRVARDDAETASVRAITRAMAAADAGGLRGTGTIPGFACYRTVQQTYSDLAALAIAHPTLARWVDIGDSWEKLHGPGAGFDLHALVLGNQSTPTPQPALVLIAAMHARELSTAELATRFAEHLIAGYGIDPDRTWLLDHRQIHIIAQLNPDGRLRAEGGALWRKNVDSGFCSNPGPRGVDLNRNSSFFWGGSGSSGQACSEIFRGPSAASEPETQAIELYLRQVFPDQRGSGMNDPAPATAEGVFISLHSFGELVLFPWEATNIDSPNHLGLRTLGRKLGFSNGYTVCQDCLGTAAGTTVDQAYGEYGVAAYTFELGTSFFESCTVFENEVLPGNLQALLYAAKAARRPYLAPLGPEVLAPAVAPPTAIAGTAVTLTATADDTRFAGGSSPEPSQAIAAVVYTVDDPPWTVPGTPMAAADGSLDSPIETVTADLDTAALSAGRHLIWLVAEDADGNAGVPTAVLLEVLPTSVLFADGFESGDFSAWSATAGR